MEFATIDRCHFDYFAERFSRSRRGPGIYFVLVFPVFVPGCRALQTAEVLFDSLSVARRASREHVARRVNEDGPLPCPWPFTL